ncbi:MAG TPA: alpha/beta fold hydrolase [Bryobacteraceae bacterium]|nr:alpha/beta fold hydrolase [Bryobacteraceae bacterium]
MKSSTWLAILAAILIAGWLQTSVRAATGGQRGGTVQMITVHGKSLEGNLEGDSPDREVYVYLPPSYATDRSRRYPVLYFLHGYGATPELYWKMMTVPATADKLMSDGAVHEFILVFPDAHTIYDGSMYSNSPTTGDWETYITHDLVKYIDSHYRTIANRDSRGLAGHSMGGYGTLRLAMKYPEVYSSIYAMSSCCLMNDPGAVRRPPARQPEAKGGSEDKGDKAPPRNIFRNVFNAEAAAWSPNPKNPPKFFDLPTEDGKVRPEIAAKWIANSPLAMVDQYVSNLKEYRAFMMDCGLQDGLVTTNQEMDASLTELGVPHKFETYEGNHVNHVKDRFEANVLPFFSENLKFKGK